MRDAFAGEVPGASAKCAVAARPGATAALLCCALWCGKGGMMMMSADVHLADVTVSGRVNDGLCSEEVELHRSGVQQYGGTLLMAGGAVSRFAVGADVPPVPEGVPGGSSPGAVVYDGVTFDVIILRVHVRDGAEGAVTAVRCNFRGGGRATSTDSTEDVLAGVSPMQTRVQALNAPTPMVVQDSMFRGLQRDVADEGCAINGSGCTFHGSHGADRGRQSSGLFAIVCGGTGGHHAARTQPPQ